jgi:mono/diheme cytochrome c family protein
MSAAKSPKALFLAVLAAVAAVLVIAGCGGSGGQVVTGQSPPKNPPSAAVEPKKEAGEEEAAEEGAAEEAISEAESGESGESESVEEGESESGEEEAEGGESGGVASAEGMTVFTSNCGSCHTLAAAGTSGNVGPNLDELMPSESVVEMQVVNGGGPMPAFGKEEILAPNEIEAVAAYVSSEAGK